MTIEEQTLKLIKELTDQVAEEANPLWAWVAVHELACKALGSNETSEEALDWAIARARELKLIHD